MIQIDPVRYWGISNFSVSEGKIISGSASCVWCERAIIIGKFVLVVQEDGRADAFAMHLACMPPEVKAARRLALDLSRLAQDQQDRTPQLV